MRALLVVTLLLASLEVRAQEPARSPVEAADPTVGAGRLAAEFASGALLGAAGGGAAAFFVVMGWFFEMLVTMTPEDPQYGFPALLGITIGAPAGVYFGARLFSDRGSVWATLVGGILGSLPAWVYALSTGDAQGEYRFALYAAALGGAVLGAMVGHEISHALARRSIAPVAVAPFRSREAIGFAAVWVF